MAYSAHLGPRQTIYLEQAGEQTTVRLHGDGQSQSSTFQTGTWHQPPRLFRAGGRLLLEIRADPAVYYGLDGTRLHALEEAPSLEGAEPVGLEEVPDGSDPDAMKPMKKMAPMKPM